MYPFSNDDSTDFQIVPDRFLKLKSEIFLQHVVETIYKASFIFGNLVFTHFQLRFASLGKNFHKHLLTTLSKLMQMSKKKNLSQSNRGIKFTLLSKYIDSF